MRYYRLILWSIVVAILCFTPATKIPEVKFQIPYLDKYIHFLMFFVLAFFLEGLCLHVRRKKLNFYAIAIVYAFLIELIQLLYVAGRNGDWKDFLADVLGLVFGGILYKFYPTWFKKFSY